MFEKIIVPMIIINATIRDEQKTPHSMGVGSTSPI